jgi:hypothetical protein
MLHFYDGQIRKFLTQFVRVLSNFSIEEGKGADGTVRLKTGTCGVRRYDSSGCKYY